MEKGESGGKTPDRDGEKGGKQTRDSPKRFAEGENG
jgi:hypothetical protein